MNLPNRLTLLRFVLVPVLIVCMLLPGTGWAYASFGVFVLAFLTDVADGQIARRCNMVTDLGKFMDPLADKAQDCSALVLLVAEGLANPAAVIVILLREFAVSGIRLVAADKGRVVAANRYGKIKTTFLNLSLSLILLLRAIGVSFLSWLSPALIYVGAALTALSGIIYVVQNLDVLKENGHA